MGIFSKKRKIELSTGELVCGKSSKYKDNKDGSITYKSGIFRKAVTYKSEHIVSDSKEGLFDNFNCSILKK